MIIAQEKKKHNIVEYLIYMYQIEDIVRAANFDFVNLKKTVIDKFDVPTDIKEEMMIWYKDLLGKMQEQHLETSGHLDFLSSLTDELYALHSSLIQDPDQLEYIKHYQIAKPHLIVYKEKSRLYEENDISICLHGVYSLFLLRLKQSALTEETERAIGSFSRILALLAKAYHEKK